MDSDRFARACGIVACALGALDVAMGSFGAHALRDRLDPQALEVFEKAVRWQGVHALALLATALLAGRSPRPRTPLCTALAGLGFSVGTVLFSGSLYALALSGHRAFGAVTPFGGVAFLVGWVALAVAFGTGGGAGGGRSDPPESGTERTVR